ncbi:MAG: CARDB domain-containing protein [Thermoplasmata archaeon]
MKNNMRLGFISIIVIILLIVSILPLSIPNASTENKNGFPVDSSIVKNIYINSTFIINSSTIDPLTGQNGFYGFDANVIIGSTGNLSVINANIYFVQDSISPDSLNIMPGGSLYLYNSTFTVTPDRYYPTLNFSINDKGGQIYTYNAKIMYPGWFNASGANLNLINTYFMNVTSKDINIANQFGYPSGNNLLISYGPTPVFTLDTIIMKNVHFNKLMQTPPNIIYVASAVPSNNRFPITIFPYQNITIANSFSISPSSLYPYTTFSNGTLTLNYSTSGKYYNDSILKVYYKNILLGSTNLSQKIKPGITNITVSFSNLIYLIEPSSLSSPGNIFVNITGSKSGTVLVNSLKLNLYTDKNLLSQNGFYKHQFNLIKSTLYGENVFISANSNYSNGNPSKNYIFMQDSNAYILNLTILPESASGGYFDPPYLMDQQSSLYLYRFAVVKVLNYNGVPLSNLTITAVPDNLPIVSGGIPLMDNQIVSNLNSILEGELNILPTLTNSSGIAILPLFTDNVSMAYWPNALYGGNYLFNISAGSRLLKSFNVGLPYFPNLNVTGNNYMINESVIVPDIVLKSISIPTTIMIHNETYQISSELYLQGESLSNVPVTFNLPGFSKTVYANLLKNEQTFVNISYTVPGSIVPGNYTVTVTVNPGKTIYESNYSNNYKSVKVEIFPDIDIGVSVPTFSKIVLYSNEYVNFSVFNRGTDLASNVPVKLLLICPNGTTISNNWLLNVSGNSNIPISYEFIPKTVGTYDVIINAPYYWDINYSNNYNFNTTSSSIVYYFIPSGTGFYIMGNITSNLPMKIELYSEIGVIGIVPDMAPNVTVTFNDLTNGIQIGSVQSYYSQGFIYANLTTNYFYYGHKYLIGLVLSNPYQNSSYVVYVYYNFTLYVPSISYISDSLSSTYMNGTTFPIYINLTTGSMPISDLNIVINFPTLSISHSWILNATAYQNISLVYYFNATINMDGIKNISVPYEIYITYPEIYPYNVILYKGQFLIIEKPNIYIQSFSYKYNSYVTNLNKVPAGTYFKVIIIIGNNGGSTAKGNTTLTLLENGKPILTQNITNISSGKIVKLYTNISSTVAGTNNIVLFVNYSGLPQKIQGPRESSFNFNVVPPATKVVMYSSSNSLAVGQRLTLTFMVVNINATEQYGRNIFVTDIPITVIMKSNSGSSTYNVYIGSNGIGVINIYPKNSGTFSIIVYYSYLGQQSSQSISSPINVQGQGLIPLWLLIVLVIVLIVVGLFVYSFIKFKKVEKNLMVCGNCGSLISADSQKCPVCGVVFEKENVKCGNCGSWIKKDAKFCPVCGTLYMDVSDPDYEKYSKLRNEYLLDTQKYREEAKRELGDKYTDEEFYKWWNTKPEFITFEKWMEKKEEEKNPTVECPVCGTLNPKGSKFCKVCGSPLPGGEENKS